MKQTEQQEEIWHLNFTITYVIVHRAEVYTVISFSKLKIYLKIQLAFLDR